MTVRIVMVCLCLWLAACGLPPDGAAADPDAAPGERLAFADITGESPDLAAHPYGGAPGWDHADKYAPGLALVDLDGDGALDLVQPRNDRADPTRRSLRLYRGRGDGTFEHAPAQVAWDDAANALAVAALDYDGDGDQDLFVAVDGGPSALYRNDGNWQLVDQAAEAGVALPGVRAFSAAPADYDGDGDVDLYVGAWNASAPDHGDGTSPNALLRNDGDGTFTDVTDAAGVGCHGWATLGAAFADFDGDGDLDLFVANDFFDACLYENLGDGTFADVAASAGVLHGAFNGMGVAVADLDGDDDLDLVVTDDEVLDDSRGNAVYLNRGSGALAFDSAAVDLGLDGLVTLAADWLVCWGVGLIDFDLDGDIDVHVATHGERSELVWRQVDGAFAPEHALMRALGDADARGSAYGDIDGDGDVDIAVGRRGEGVQVLRNDAPARPWIAVTAPRGTLVRAAGQLRTVPAGDGYLSSSPARVVIGIGDATTVEVEARLPDGRVERATVAAGTTAAF